MSAHTRTTEDSGQPSLSKDMDANGVSVELAVPKNFLITHDERGKEVFCHVDGLAAQRWSPRYCFEYLSNRSWASVNSFYAQVASGQLAVSDLAPSDPSLQPRGTPARPGAQSGSHGETLKGEEYPTPLQGGGGESEGLDREIDNARENRSQGGALGVGKTPGRSGAEAVGEAGADDAVGVDGQGARPESVKRGGKWDRATWRMKVAYNGAAFDGWQAQPGLFTVQGVLEEALAPFAEGKLAQARRQKGEKGKAQVVVAGRTDKGVHAAAQVCSFYTWEQDTEADDIVEAINAAVPGALRATDVSQVPRSFHPNFSATWRRYVYLLPLHDGEGGACSQDAAALFPDPFGWGWKPSPSDGPLHAHQQPPPQLQTKVQTAEARESGLSTLPGACLASEADQWAGSGVRLKLGSELGSESGSELGLGSRAGVGSGVASSGASEGEEQRGVGDASPLGKDAAFCPGSSSSASISRARSDLEVNSGSDSGARISGRPGAGVDSSARPERAEGLSGLDAQAGAVEGATAAGDDRCREDSGPPVSGAPPQHTRPQSEHVATTVGGPDVSPTTVVGERKPVGIDVPAVDRLLRALEGRPLGYSVFARDTKAGRSSGPATVCHMYRASASIVRLPPQPEGGMPGEAGQRAMRVELVADRFLRRMVRVLVATAVREAAAGASEGGLRYLMDVNDRRATAPPAPPDGLCLAQVGYSPFI
eukprot:jgi/Mesen1/6925/ME000359S06126